MDTDMKRILWCLVLYPCRHFDYFLQECFQSIAKQSYKNFTLFCFLDGVEEESIHQICHDLGIPSLLVHHQNLGALNPSQIRHHMLSFAIENQWDFIVFCDFDEQVDPHRLELALTLESHYDFSYCNAYLTDLNNQRLCDQSLHQLLKIPPSIQEIMPILDKNFIGLGSLNLSLRRYKHIHNPNLPPTLAYDWFLATHMLLHHLKGSAIPTCFTQYRQHEETYIGLAKELNPHTLDLGIQVKLAHYGYFKDHHQAFKSRYKQMIRLRSYLGSHETRQKYIRIINDHYNPLEMNWWENIKSLEEIRQWI